MEDSVRLFSLDGPQGARLERVPLDKLVPHPQNPRLVMREDVVASIEVQLRETGRFHEKYALHVRPVNGCYQILAGHHRHEAAKRAEVPDAPCWVEEMDDGRAFMQLVLSNAQGELSPLEWGIHALRFVERATGGRGAEGGMSAYARATGLDRANLLRYRDAAAVMRATCENLCNITQVTDKANHLATIHKAPRETWPVLVEAMLAGGWTVQATDEVATAIRDTFADLPSWWDAIDTGALVQRLIAKPKQAGPITKVLKQARAISEELKPVTIYRHVATEDNEIRDGREYRRLDPVAEQFDQGAEFRRLVNVSGELDANRLTKAKATVLGFARDLSDSVARWEPVLTEAEWRKKRRQEREIARLTRQQEVAAQVRSAIMQGDSRQCILSSPVGVRLLLTDPPYGMEFQSNRRVASAKAAPIEGDTDAQALALLREVLAAAYPRMADDSAVLVWSGDLHLPQFIAAVECAGFEYRRLLVWDKPNHGAGDLDCPFPPGAEFVIYATKGHPTRSQSRVGPILPGKEFLPGDHPTRKPLDLLRTLIEATTDPGELVVDPFIGIGSTAVAAVQTARAYWGCELDADYHWAACDGIAAAILAREKDEGSEDV